MLVEPFNKIIIARYIGHSEVTYYQIATQLVMTIRSLFVKGLEAVMPKFSEQNSNIVNSLKLIQNTRAEAMKYIYMFALPAFLFTFIIANPIIKLWLRDMYNINIAIAVRILLIGWLLNLLAVPDYFLFIGIGKVKTSVIATCIKSFLNITIIMVILFSVATLDLYTVVLIESLTLMIAMGYLKIKYSKFIKLNL